MTLPDFLRDHIEENLTPVPFTADDLACAASIVLGRKVSADAVEGAMRELVAHGNAQADGDGWIFAERRAETKQAELFA